MQWFGVVAGALVVGVILGVLFRVSYPSVSISTPLSLLFALVGLLIVGGIRALWQALWGKQE